MSGTAWIGGVLALAASVALPLESTAQIRDLSPPMTRAQSAERRGQYAEAAVQYNIVLDERPTDGPALSGLERVLVPLGRGAEVALRLSRALDIDSLNVGLLGLAVRTFAASGQPDSAAHYAERWARIEPGAEGPYREWAIAAVEGRDRQSARRALETGRRALARPGALAPELAQVLQLDGNWVEATREWLRAADGQPAYRMSAVAALARSPISLRPDIRAALGAARTVEAPLIHALLEARWGNIADGTRILLNSLPANAEQAVSALRAMVEETKGREEPVVLRARGTLLEAMADREAPGAGLGSRMEAARAYADAGDEAAARRLLAKVAADPAAPSGMATTASATLLGVLLAEGRADEADRVLTQLLPVARRRRTGASVASSGDRSCPPWKFCSCRRDRCARFECRRFRPARPDPAAARRSRRRDGVPASRRTVRHPAGACGRTGDAARAAASRGA